jgi:hypothetical protein
MRRYHRCLIAAAVVLGWSSASIATEVFGITLHQPLRGITECLKRQDAYLSDDHEQCYKWPQGVTPADTLPSNGQIVVNVPVQDRPNYMNGSDVMVGLKDGRVVSVSTRTHGTEGGDDQHWLEMAFGKPQQTDPQPDANGALTVNWSLPDGTTVYYDNAEWDRRNGFVRVQAPDASPHQFGIWD